MLGGPLNGRTEYWEELGPEMIYTRIEGFNLAKGEIGKVVHYVYQKGIFEADTNYYQFTRSYSGVDNEF